MIYLLQDCYKNDKGEYVDILKIGYSEKPFMESRNNQYRTHNYGYKFLGEREGNTEIESLFHERYSSLFLGSTEWMIYEDKVVDEFFNLSEDDLWLIPKEIEKSKLVENLSNDLIKTLPSISFLYDSNKDSLIEEFKKYTKDESEIEIGLRKFKEGLTRCLEELEEEYSINSILETPFIKSLPDVIDVSLDLPQILGRQRLKENVFRNEVLILYKAETKKGAVINEKELVNEKKVRVKEEKTLEMLRGYENMTEEQQALCAEKWARDNELYKNDYLGISNRTGKAVFNYLVKIADKRAYDVTRKEYIDDITIRRGVESISSDGYRVSE